MGLNPDITGKLIVVAAPSGAGKTTLVQMLMQEDLQLSFSVSACSRKPRDNEVNGRDYYFLSPEEFRRRIDDDEFIEWEEVYPGSYYGTLRSEVNRIRNQGRHVVFDIDVKGAMSIKKQFGANALTVFIRPPSIEVLEERLRSRSADPEESIRTRLERSRYELGMEDDFDTKVINDSLERAAEELSRKVRAFIEKNRIVP